MDGTGGVSNYMSDKYIDVRHRDTIELLDTCATCKTDYVVRLHHRHECGDCNRKWLHENFDRPFGKFWDDMWKSFDRMFERIFGKD